MTTGQRIKAARKSVGMTQEELGEKLGVSGSAIAQYETDNRKPKYDTIKRIAAALNVEAWTLMGNDGSIRVSLPKYPLPMVTEEQFNRMPPTEQDYYALRLLVETAPDALKKQYVTIYDKLNKFGKVEAVQRMQELARLHEYTDAQPPTDAPQSPPAPQEGKDTTPPPDAPETAPEGE